ncbi:crossover junction endonuclease MUS81 [Manduca sexta]|uniref:Crossover junction endonuclease MUS81 n=1 Tax=Manduca sexta TaxID=7130 RepID=A0A921ZA83_MANSE|nr:crossover junction endonuclease MUS81 [Manduca sexta]KAG6454302.1 hypothetical protein O3G_MSEX008623 [Manduca sexta]
MSVEAFRKRIMYRHYKPNALFEGWIKELLVEAVEKKSKLEPMLREAFESLRKYPLPLKSGSDCAILKGFHKKLCKFLDHRFSIYENIILEEARSHGLNEDDAHHNEEGNEICERRLSTSERTQAEPHPFNRLNPLIPGQRMAQQYVHFYFRNLVPTPYIQNSARAKRTGPGTHRTGPSTSNAAQNSTSKPPYRSGAYAILLTLLKHARGSDVRSLPKKQIIEFAQQYSDESFTVVKPGTHNTAWCNMTRLVKRGLVSTIRKKKMEYTLTDTGKDVAIDLLIEDTERPNSIGDSGARVPAFAAVNEPISFEPGSYDVVLLIDKNETGGATRKNEPAVALFSRYPRLKHEYRSLKVGDFAWIARHHVTKQELVLPYIVERKRYDDFAASIKDGRFHEQKFRLHKCGLSNVFYMVESYGRNKNLGMPLQTLKQAVANTRVQDGFKTIFSDSLSHSVRLMALLTIKLTAEYREEQLAGRNGAPRGDELMTFEYFTKVSSKNKSLTVTELFIKQLLQLKGLSVEKALAITKRYPTPMLLLDEYKKHDTEGGLMLLAYLKYGDMGRNVGPQVSRTIYQLFSDESI